MERLNFMTKQNFKVGDWGYHDFKLVQIREIDENGQVNRVTDGNFEMSGWKLNFYPLTLETKSLSESFEYYSNQVRTKGRNGGLNIPNFNREMVRRWEECCDNLDNRPFVTAELNRTTHFVREIEEELDGRKQKEVQGIDNLFR